MTALLLWLEAPLQSWGVDSRFGRRDTLAFPSRSGVLGLICCAMGRGGGQETWLAEMKNYTQTVVAYARLKKDKPDIQPLLRDFQMVGSGYDASDPWQDMLIPKKADGKRPVGAGTKMTYRYYLQDMAFACALDVPDTSADEIIKGLQNPVWPICLGRKSCVPTDMVYRGRFDSQEEALASAGKIAEDKSRAERFRVAHGRVEGGNVLTLNDVPIAFGLRKRYEDRQVTVLEQ